MSDRALLARLTSGDHGAFETLVEHYLPELLRYTYGIVRSREVAEDVVQDVLCWLWDHHETLTVRESLRDYLFSAVRHRALNHLRAAHAGSERDRRYAGEEAGQDISIAPGDPSLAFEHQELVAAVARAIEQLPARRREIVLLRWRQLTYGEIADILGISVKTVEAQITSAYRTLRETLGDWVK